VGFFPRHGRACDPHSTSLRSAALPEDGEGEDPTLPSPSSGREKKHPAYFTGTIAVTSTSTIMPGYANCTMLRSVLAGGGVAAKISERHLP